MSMGISVGGWINNLTVEPDIMVGTADRALDRAKQARDHITELKEIVRSSNGYWLGDGGDAYRRFFDELEVEINEALGMLNNDIEKLNAIAQNYRTAEMENEAKANSLPSDVIL